MRRNVSYLAAAFCAGMLTLLSPLQASANPYEALAQSISAAQPHAATLLAVGYYGGGDYDGDDQKPDDDGYGQKQDYYGGGYRRGEYGGGQKYGYGDNDGGYRYHRKHYDYPDRCCNNSCYKKKWVCEESEPRCRKARECVWYYGKEYCRDVRRCHGGGDRYCKWISVRSGNCGW
jgi:hypothetical protein